MTRQTILLTMTMCLAAACVIEDEAELAKAALHADSEVTLANELAPPGAVLAADGDMAANADQYAVPGATVLDIMSDEQNSTLDETCGAAETEPSEGSRWRHECRCAQPSCCSGTIIECKADQGCGLARTYGLRDHPFYPPNRAYCEARGWERICWTEYGYCNSRGYYYKECRWMCPSGGCQD